MLVDSGYYTFAPLHGGAVGCLNNASRPDLGDDNPFQALYIRSVDVSGQHRGPVTPDSADAVGEPMLELDAELDNKSLFVDAFQYWRQDGGPDGSVSGGAGMADTCHVVSVKTEPVAGGLPHMIPGSRRFASPVPPADPPPVPLPVPPPAPQPQSILLHTGTNVVDLVSGVTCSGVGLGALGRGHEIGDLANGQQQGNFGHLLRQRPASLGGELYSFGTSVNQVVTRQRPHSEDLQMMQDLHGLEDDDDDDDDVFLTGYAQGVSANTSHRQRLSSSSNSNEDGSEDDDMREDGTSECQCRWSECGLQFSGRAPLVRHIEKVHVEPRRGEDFSCLWHRCPRGARPFNARYKLLIHMRVHSGEKPNKCPFPGCPKAFSRLENLKIHQRSHTGERPYCCQFAGCNKAFSNSSDRAKHQRTHFDTKPYACQVPGCSKRYTDPSSLRKHVKNHSGKDHAHAQARRAGSTGSSADSDAPSEGSTSSELSQSSQMAQGEGYEYQNAYADSLEDSMFPSADDIDQAIREFIPFDEVGKMLAEPSGVSGFDLHEPLEFDFDTSFWNCSD